MAFWRPLTIQGGVYTQLSATDSLFVGAGIDTTVAQILTIGASNASQVHIVPALTIAGLLAPGGGLLVTGTGTFNNDLVVTGVTTLNNDLNQSGGEFNLNGNSQSSITTSAGGINLIADGLMNVDSTTGTAQLGAALAAAVIIGHGAAIPVTIRGAVAQDLGTYFYTGNGWVVNANGASALTTTAGPLNIDAAGTLSIGGTTQTTLSLGRTGAPSRLDGSALAFFTGTAPVAKQSITGILSAVADVNARNVLTSIIAALSAATGYNLVNNTTT